MDISLPDMLAHVRRSQDEAETPAKRSKKRTVPSGPEGGDLQHQWVVSMIARMANAGQVSWRDVEQQDFGVIIEPCAELCHCALAIQHVQ